MTDAEKLQRALQCLKDIVHPMAKFERERQPHYQRTGCKFTKWSKCSKAEGLREESKEFGRRQYHAE
jgi:hypothetical protein